MNTPKKYTRDELATKVRDLTIELATLKTKLASSEENRKYAWDTSRWATNHRYDTERKLRGFMETNNTMRGVIEEQETKILSLTRWNKAYVCLGWSLVGSIAALLYVLICR